MRTLGKLRHERHVAPTRPVPAAQERLKVRTSEWAVWRKRALLLHCREQRRAAGGERQGPF